MEALGEGKEDDEVEERREVGEEKLSEVRGGGGKNKKGREI